MYMESTLNLKLTWEMVVSQFESLIKFAARQQVENRGTDNSISAEDLYQEGMIKLHQCWQKWCVEQGKDMDEFGPIFRTSLFRRVRQVGGKRAMHIDLEDASNTLEDTSTEDPVERMYVEHGINHLKSILSSEISRNLLEDMIQPSARTLYEVWVDIKRKEMIKSQGYKTNIPTDTTVRMKHRVRSLGITNKQYDIAVAEIRSKAKQVLKFD